MKNLNENWNYVHLTSLCKKTILQLDWQCIRSRGLNLENKNILVLALLLPLLNKLIASLNLRR